MLILNSDLEYVKLVNTMTRQRDTATGASYRNRVLGNAAMDTTILKTNFGAINFP